VMDDVALVLRRFGDLPMEERTSLKSGLVFLMIDLDDFKGINDTCGHPAGDEVLLQIRDTLQRVCRDSDILIRWGGDEFLVVARDTSVNHAETVAERIRVGIGSQSFALSDGRVVRLSCSIGFACFPFLPSLPDLCSWDDVLALADSALYGAKNSGRDAWIGLVSTGRVPTTATFSQMRTEPERLVDQGYLEVRSVPTSDKGPDGE
jgi:diguanylate cyclase (GGDEF)-like protein